MASHADVTSLDQAIDDLYATFARYPLATRIEGCPHCELERAEKSLHRVRLRELTPEDLGVFPFKAMTTFGGVDDFRHFLPRIAELLTFTGDVGACSLDIFAGKLVYGEWHAWPALERDALNAWFGALEDDYLFHGRVVLRAYDLLAALEARGTDAEAFVARWADATTERAVNELAHEVLALASSSNTGTGRSTTSLVRRRASVEETLRAARARGRAMPEVQAALEVLAFPPFV